MSPPSHLPLLPEQRCKVSRMLSAPRAEGTRSLPARLPALLAPPVPPLTSSHLCAPRTQQEPRDGPTGKGHCCPWLCPKTCSTQQEQPARRRALASCGHPKPVRDKLFCPVPFYPRSKNSWALFLWVGTNPFQWQLAHSKRTLQTISSSKSRSLPSPSANPLSAAIKILSLFKAEKQCFLPEPELSFLIIKP